MILLRYFNEVGGVAERIVWFYLIDYQPRLYKLIIKTLAVLGCGAVIQNVLEMDLNKQFKQ